MIVKRGVSPVIATVLLLVLTLVSVSILAAFVVPFVNQSLKGSESCLEIFGDLKFDETGYNCYATNPSSFENRTGLSVQISDNKVVGFKTVMFLLGDSEPYDIKSGSKHENIRALSGDFNQSLGVPSKGGVRTYVFNGTYDRAYIYPILKSGKQCDESDDIRLVQCASPDIINDLIKK